MLSGEINLFKFHNLLINRSPMIFKVVAYWLYFSEKILWDPPNSLIFFKNFGCYGFIFLNGS